MRIQLRDVKGRATAAEEKAGRYNEEAKSARAAAQARVKVSWVVVQCVALVQAIVQ